MPGEPTNEGNWGGTSSVSSLFARVRTALRVDLEDCGVDGWASGENTDAYGSEAHFGENINSLSSEEDKEGDLAIG